MSKTHPTTDLPGTEQVETIWEEFTAEAHETLYEKMRSSVLRRIDEGCKRQINAGNYDATITLQTVFEWFEETYLTDDSAFVEDVLESDAVFLETIEYDRRQLGHLVLERLIGELEENGEVLYVYDRQRVRSRVAEMARYFALIRQRLQIDGGTAIDFSPSLVKMVKMEVLDREQPIFDPERASRFGPTLREINKRVNSADAEPAAELAETVGSDWRDTIGETVEFMGEFFNDGLPDEIRSLADYQADSFIELYLDAVTKDAGEADLSHVITASTGGGKTEAFLFPILAYCHTAWRAGISGNKAVLTYPRRDLCDNQFERLVEYAFTINERLGKEHASLDEAPISVAIQHGSRTDTEIECPFCDGTMAATDYEEGRHFACQRDPENHVLRWATANREKPADVIVTTQNSLHLRLMDKYGKSAFWSSTYPTKFLVLDEVHVYTEQSGMHVSNVVRRFKRALKHRNSHQSPTLVASSATIEEAKDFTRRIFDTESAELHSPSKTESTGSEYMLFVKSTEPRDVEIPIGDSVFRPQNEWEDIHRTTASNLSCMIQIAFAFYHTVRKERQGSRDGLNVDKDRILGFVDSIDSVGRLGRYLDNAEDDGLFELRRPDAFLHGEGENPDCPKERFREGTDEELDETAVCESVVPNKHLNECSVYEAGECWWTMRDRQMDLRPMSMAIHKSGQRQRPSDQSDPGNDWKHMIATSALEVGFDHPSIIGTYQYRAPMSVPGFIQRKGRGGRDAEDNPITVVVLGSTSTDSFYFHHSEYLSHPGSEHLEIPLDEDNRFVRAEHMTSAIFDYLNVTDSVNSQRIYRGRPDNQGPDIDFLDDVLYEHRSDIAEWLRTGFGLADGDGTAEEVIDNVVDYLETLDEPLVPGEDDTAFWKAFGTAVEEAGKTGSSTHIDTLAQSLRESMRGSTE